MFFFKEHTELTCILSTGLSLFYHKHFKVQHVITLVGIFCPCHAGAGTLDPNARDGRCDHSKTLTRTPRGTETSLPNFLATDPELVKTFQRWPYSGSRGKVKGSRRLVIRIYSPGNTNIWTHFKAIHHWAVWMFQPEPKWWTDWLTHIATLPATIQAAF